jgi:hypothetical protein
MYSYTLNHNFFENMDNITLMYMANKSVTCLAQAWFYLVLHMLYIAYLVTIQLDNDLHIQPNHAAWFLK